VRERSKSTRIPGATQGLGLALVEGLAARLDAADTVYLTGRSEERTAMPCRA
jgi:short-subunit dehydrogenase